MPATGMAWSIAPVREPVTVAVAGMARSYSVLTTRP